MATLPELEAALVKADAAGNVDDAKAFAGAIRSMRVQAQPKRDIAAEIANDPISQGAQKTLAASPADLISANPIVRTMTSAARPVIGAARLVENLWGGTSNADRLKTLDEMQQRGGDALYGNNTIIGPRVMGALSDVSGGLLGVGGAATKLPSTATTFGRVAQGAELGGLAGVTSGSDTPLESAGVGMAVGGVIPGAWEAAKAVGRGVRNVAQPYLSKAGADAAAGRLASHATGADNEAIIAALRSAAPGETSAQAAFKVGNPEFSALQDLAAQKAQKGYIGIAEAQRAERRAKLAALLGADSQEGGALAVADARKALSKEIGPKIETELAAANAAGKYGTQLQSKADALGAAASGSVGDVRRISMAQQKAQELAQAGRGRLDVSAPGNPPGMGMPRLGAQYFYPNELANMAEGAAQKSADASLALGQGARFAQMQADSLAAHGLHPIDTTKLIGTLNTKLQNPGIGANEVTKNVLTKVGKLIEEWTANGGGVIDARALHEIRKSAINNEVEKLMGSGAKQSAIKERAASILTQVKPLIDDAIESAGGTGWRQVMDEFAKGSHLISRQKMAAKALDLFDKNPNGLISLAGGGEPQMVSKIFGPGRVSLSAEMGGTEKPITEVAGLISRDKKLADLASKGMPAAREAIGRSMPEIPPTGWFKPIISAARGAYNAVTGHATDRIMKDLADRMRDPKAFAEVMQNAKPYERQAIVDALMKYQGAALTQGQR